MTTVLHFQEATVFTAFCLNSTSYCAVAKDKILLLSASALHA